MLLGLLPRFVEEGITEGSCRISAQNMLERVPTERWKPSERVKGSRTTRLTATLGEF